MAAFHVQHLSLLSDPLLGEGLMHQRSHVTFHECCTQLSKSWACGHEDETTIDCRRQLNAIQGHMHMLLPASGCTDLLIRTRSDQENNSGPFGTMQYLQGQCNHAGSLQRLWIGCCDSNRTSWKAGRYEIPIPRQDFDTDRNIVPPEVETITAADQQAGSDKSKGIETEAIPAVLNGPSLNEIRGNIQPAKEDNLMRAEAARRFLEEARQSLRGAQTPPSSSRLRHPVPVRHAYSKLVSGKRLQVPALPREMASKSVQKYRVSKNTWRGKRDVQTYRLPPPAADSSAFSHRVLSSADKATLDQPAPLQNLPRVSTSSTKTTKACLPHSRRCRPRNNLRHGRHWWAATSVIRRQRLVAPRMEELRRRGCPCCR